MISGHLVIFQCLTAQFFSEPVPTVASDACSLTPVWSSAVVDHPPHCKKKTGYLS